MPEASSDASEKWARILDATLSLFLRYGVQRTSIDDVAREAGIAKGTVYLYFDSKIAFFAAVADRFCSDMLAKARAIVAEAKPASVRLVEFLDCYIGQPHRLVEASPHVRELTASKEAITAAGYADHDRKMKVLLGGLLNEAGIVDHDAAINMFIAAALGALKTGDIAENAYRARLTGISNVLLRGLASEVEP